MINAKRTEVATPLIDQGELLAKIMKEKEKKQMELRVKKVQLPEQILFNYEELKQELIEKVSMYETMVYTDEQIKEAKADKANLNKLKKALNDERIRREKEYMQPFNDFKAKINEIIGIIDKPVAVIDKQVKEYEEKKKQEKYDEIRFYWEEKVDANNVPEYIKLEQIFNEKWLNASVSMKSIQDEITSRLEQIETDLATLSNLPEFGFEATEVYKTTLDINKALNEGRRLSEMAKRKAEHEAAMQKIVEEQKAKADQVPGQVEFTDTKSFDSIVEDAMPLKQWISFSALLSTEDALALKEFFNNRNIEFKAV